MATWTNIAGGVGFQNSWADASVGVSQPPASFNKDADGAGDNFVRLRGWIAGGARGTVAFVLPTGFQPTERQAFNTAYYQTDGTPSVTYIAVDTDGTVTIHQNAFGEQWIDLSCVGFYTA